MLQPGRLRQVTASITSSKQPPAGGQPLKATQALNQPVCVARTGPLAGGQGPCPWLLTQPWGLRNKSNHLSDFVWWHLCSCLAQQFGKPLCSSLSAMTCFRARAQLPMVRCASAGAVPRCAVPCPGNTGTLASHCWSMCGAPHDNPQLHSPCHQAANRFDPLLARGGG